MYIQMTSPQPQGAGMSQGVAMEAIVQRLRTSKDNQEFLDLLSAEN